MFELVRDKEDLWIGLVQSTAAKDSESLDERRTGWRWTDGSQSTWAKWVDAEPHQTEQACRLQKQGWLGRWSHDGLKSYICEQGEHSDKQIMF